jgi:hypothetical protein
MTIKKIRIILTFAVITLTIFSVNGQQLFKCDSTKSYWAFEKDNSFFAIKLLGKVREQERKMVIAVNNYILQYVIVDKKNYIKSDSIAADLKVLTNYALNEAEYMTGLFKQKLNIQMQKALSSSDKTVLIWFFEMPSNVSQEVKHQVFANIVIGDKIFGLSSSQFESQKLDDVKNFLMDVIGTLKKVNVKTDFNNLCRF